MALWTCDDMDYFNIVRCYFYGDYSQQGKLRSTLREFFFKFFLSFFIYYNFTHVWYDWTWWPPNLLRLCTHTHKHTHTHTFYGSNTPREQNYGALSTSVKSSRPRAGWWDIFGRRRCQSNFARIQLVLPLILSFHPLPCCSPQSAALSSSASRHRSPPIRTRAFLRLVWCNKTVTFVAFEIIAVSAQNLPKLRRLVASFRSRLDIVGVSASMSSRRFGLRCGVIFEWTTMWRLLKCLLGEWNG